MGQYSQQRREAVVAKMLPPNEQDLNTLAHQEGISLGTLYRWRRDARQQGACVPNSDAGNPDSWSARDKFAAVMETAAMNEHEIGEYCRRRGLYREQIQQWRSDCERAADLADDERQSQGNQVREERKRANKLQSELKRKEAALAETAALLSLSKKAQAIWGDGKDE